MNILEEYTELSNSKIVLQDHINTKILLLRDKLQFISLKYDDIRKMFNNFSLTILIISAFLTLLDAFKLLLGKYMGETEKSTKDMTFSLNLLSLFLGTLMTIFTSIIRFKNYRENMEKLKELEEKVIQLKTKYAKEECILSLLEDNYKEEIIRDIKKRIEDYNILFNEINIIGFISNKKMLKFKKYIENFKVSIFEIDINGKKRMNELN